MPESRTPPAQKKASRLRRLLRWPLRIALSVLALLALYFGAALVLGLVPRNSDWTPPAEGIEIFVTSNGVHCDFVVPASDAKRDWRARFPLSVGEGSRFAGREKGAPWVHFGWGDRSFFLETPRWSDLELSTALRALFWPTPTLMHVSFEWYRPEEGENCQRILVTQEQYEALLAHIEASFATSNDGAHERLDGRGYHDYDDFYAAKGSYHCVYSCNEWVNDGLRKAGIRCATWAPFDAAIFYQLGRTR